jgi:His-Xaa-Ser system protein HxsD
MISFERISENAILVKINKSIFNDIVITKTLYWLQSEHITFWNSSLDGNTQNITLEKKDGSINNEEYVLLKKRISQNLIDFKTRDIINRETKNIRDILYIKAFANGDDFEDYNLINS